MNSMEDYLDFIAEYEPRFGKRDGKHTMFTVPTQHIEADSVQELLDIGIECAKRQNGKSPLGHFIAEIESFKIVNCLTNETVLEGNGTCSIEAIWSENRIIGNTITIKDGKELKQVDNFTRFLEDFKQEFIKQEDYSGFPHIPKNYYKGLEIYNEADKDEKKMLFHLLYSQFSEALRHWKVDKDVLYCGRKDKALEQFKDLIPFMKKGWEKFWY